MVGDLTEQVLKSAWRPHTDWRFYPVPPGEGIASEGLAARAQHLIRIVHTQIQSHLFSREGRPPNYEDYFSYLKQVVQDETGEIVNPLIAKNVECLRTAAAFLYVDSDAHIDNNRFASLVERASDLIQCVVSHALRGLGNPAGMALFTAATRAFGSVDIFSLNHDLLIEKHFETERISYADGLADQDGDVMVYTRSWDNQKKGPRLFKLHGSVDWYLFRFKSRGIDQYARIRTNPELAKDASGEALNSLEIFPNFLTGTTVKEQTYGYGLYGDLFEEFRHRLRVCHTLICSGYGWSDKGINIRINEWLRNRRENRVILLHGKDGESL